MISALLRGVATIATSFLKIRKKGNRDALYNWWQWWQWWQPQFHLFKDSPPLMSSSEKHPPSPLSADGFAVRDASRALRPADANSEPST
jgi:hypothetical protein